MNVSDYDYDLPPELIAQHPLAERAASRMLVVDRRTGATAHHSFREFPAWLRPGDCLVLNDTRVIPARLFGHKSPGGARAEAMLVEPCGDHVWKALLRPGRRLPPGTRVILDHGLNHDAPPGSDAAANAPAYTVIAKDDASGIFHIRLETDDDLALLDRVGRLPLPPYISRDAAHADLERYQTVYAARPGAVAAPTAGLHLTDEILAELVAANVQIARVTLHVGIGTFQPVAAERLEDHVMHEERYHLPEAAAATINGTRAAGGRVIAIGTTSVRVLETCAAPDGRVTPGEGRTRLFMHPPQRPRCVDGLVTNFHLPRSTLLMLVSTFASREALLAAYADAIAERYRFYSYGDCMLMI